MANLSNVDVVLNPRPYERDAGRLLLVPLLPEGAPKASLPAEVWERVLAYAIHGLYRTEQSRRCLSRAQWRAEIGTVCKMFSVLVPPLLFAHPTVSTSNGLRKLSSAIHEGNARWDSLRRILHSTPGRWVLSLDLSSLEPGADALAVDTLLRNMLPLVPFLDELRLNSFIQLSRPTFDVLRTGSQAHRMRVLTGICFSSPHLGLAAPPNATAATKAMYQQHQDPVLRLLRACDNLQELELVSPHRLGGEDEEDDDEWPVPEGSEPELHDMLELLRLDTLHLSLRPSSAIITLLCRSPLPALQRLTIAGELAIATDLLSAHGSALRALALSEGLATSDHAPEEYCPPNLLALCGSLRHLVLPCSAPKLDPVRGVQHPLVTLSIPRPTPDFLRSLEAGLFPALRVVQLRETRWLPRGVAGVARRTGVAGEMARWRTRLGRMGIRVLDIAGQEEQK